MTWFVRILARALALAVAIMGVPAMAQDYPTRIVMRVFSPTASTALTLGTGPV